MGNEAFRRGEFERAVDHYSRCLGMNPFNGVVFSNRAMAHLMRKDFVAAEEDCHDALRLLPGHVKSYLRRAAARNGQGRHREALVDLAQVLALEPGNRQADAEVRKIRELRRTAMRRTYAADLTVRVGVSGDLDRDEVTRNGEDDEEGGGGGGEHGGEVEGGETELVDALD